MTLRTRHGAGLDLARVEAITRDVIADCALPMEILAVDVAAAGWRLLVRDMSHHVVDITIAYATSAAQVRAQLKERLDTVYG